MSEQLGLQIALLIAHELHLEIGDISRTSKLIQDLEADSLVVANIVLKLEEAFEITLVDSSASNPSSSILNESGAEDWMIQDIVEAVDAALQAKADKVKAA